MSLRAAAGRRSDLTALATLSLLAAAVTAAIRTGEQFDHGIWLVAYLFLVGFAAQLLLGVGQAMLLDAAGARQPSSGARRAQLALWNAGVVAVPLGVFLDARLGVVAGGAALLAALASFHASARPGLSASVAPASLRRAYVALLCFMAASTLVGTGLAWDSPWL